MEQTEKSYATGVSELASRLGYGKTDTFWRRVNSLPILVKELQDSGWAKGQKVFTAQQMKLICDRIGYPEN